MWKTAERVQRPGVYWSMVALFLAFAVVFLGGAYGLLAGWFPLRDHR